MERVTITIPPPLLEKIDQERERLDLKRSAFIVRTLEECFREIDVREKTKEELLEALKTGEGKALLREVVQEVRGGPGRPPGSGTGQRKAPERGRPRGDKITITEDMKELMQRFRNNPDRPTRREVKDTWGVDISDIRRWVSGEKQNMTLQTWERLEPILLQFAGEK
jgi:hypothetical protein